MNNSVIGGTPEVGPDQSILKPLVITLRVVMRCVHRDRVMQRRLLDENHLHQAFLLDRAYEALRVKRTVYYGVWDIDPEVRSVELVEAF